MEAAPIHWQRERWPHERGFGSDSGYVAQYKGHEMSIRENGGPYSVWVDGQPLTRDDGHEGFKWVNSARDAQNYCVRWVDGKIKKPGPRTLLAPEYGFGTYFAAQTVMVSRVVDGKFEVRVEDPFESRMTVSKIFKVDQDPTGWIIRQIAKRMKKWLPEFLKHRGREIKEPVYSAPDDGRHEYEPFWDAPDPYWFPGDN